MVLSARAALDPEQHPLADYVADLELGNFRRAQPGLARGCVTTRKSAEDGVGQESSSLDVQYEACVAYALSQRHQGFSLVLDAVAAAKIDIILVYKIDRLTRSLADFAKIAALG